MTSTMSFSNISEPEVEVEEFSCNNCDNKFKLRRALMMHMRNKHNQQGSNGSMKKEEEEEVVEESPPKKEEVVRKFGQRHRCLHCGEAFRKLPTMLLHVREDHPEENTLEDNVEEDKPNKIIKIVDTRVEGNKEEDVAEKMLGETEKVEEEKAEKDRLETTIHEDLGLEDGCIKEIEENISREGESPEDTPEYKGNSNKCKENEEDGLSDDKISPNKEDMSMEVEIAQIEDQIKEEIPKDEEILEEKDKVALGDGLEAKTNDTEGSTLKEEADQRMAEDMDDIIKLCNEINEYDAQGRVAHQVVEKGLDDTEETKPETRGEHDDKEEDGPTSTKEGQYDEKQEDNPYLMKEVEENKREDEVFPGVMEEDPAGAIDDLSQEEDEEDVSSQCKHCGVDMVIDTELKKHIILRYAFYPVIGFLYQDYCSPLTIPFSDTQSLRLQRKKNL